MKQKAKKKAVIIGAGPAGITAGSELSKTNQFSVTLLERDKIVGGLAKTTEYNGARFDIGPHHFITEAEEIITWWQELMEGDFHTHKRFTRIYYNKHFFHYPLEPWNVITGLNIFECARSVLSYLKIRLFPIKDVKSFEDWVTNKFGRRLFSIFFKTYTEKVWGIECSKISSDWAAQRIKGFSLSKAIFYAFFGRFFKKNKPRTIRDTFYYPSKGSGTLWEKAATRLLTYDDSAIFMNEEVVSLEHNNDKIIAVSTRKKPSRDDGAQQLTRYDADYFFSTMPLLKLIMALDPIAPTDVIDAAHSLKYRGLITVNLIVNKTNVCPDHWLYVHEKSVKMGRIGNMNNFSSQMVADPSKQTALSLEYFTFVGGDLWKMSDNELVDLGRQELASIGLVKAEDVIDGMIMRTSEAYPVYDANYKEHLDKVLKYLAQFSNLQLMGRNGMHRYNNMDVAMLSAMSAVEKVLEQEKQQIDHKAKKSESVYLT